MKSILTVIIVMFAGALIGQPELGVLKGVKILDRKQYKEEDTIPKVIYLKECTVKDKLIIKLDDKMYEEQLLGTINTNLIESINIEKVIQDPDYENYGGAILITLKDDYQPKLISLNQLKSKYVKDVFNPTLFFINEKPIKGDYDQCIVDEKFIMKIEVDKIINDNEGLNLTIIKLITRTDKNLEKANTIYLRGDEQ